MGFVENDVIMLVFHILSRLLHAHALYNVLCCGVYTILLIKCLFRCFYV